MPAPAYDVIVLGVGAMGSAALFQLARRGARVLGIDRFTPPHTHGSSHGETRITRQAIGEGAHYVPLVLRSHEIWAELEAATGAKLLEITGGLIISSTKTVARNHVPAFFRATLDAAKAFGIAHRMLDAAQIRAEFPQFNVQDDEHGYWERNAGFLRPEACIAAQLTMAQRHGAAVAFGETMINYEAGPAGVVVRTDRGEYHGGKLILAAGPWLPHLLGGNARHVFKVHRQVLFWFDLERNADAFLPGRFPIFIWEPQGKAKVIYGFPTARPGGGIKVATEEYATTTDPDGVSRDVARAEVDAIYDELVAPLFPDVARRVLDTATCLYTVTPDSGFVIDWHPAQRNVLVASPCSGHGFKHSAAIGEALAELALDGSSRFDLSKFAIARLGLSFDRT